MEMSIFEEIGEFLQQGRAKSVKELCQKALDSGELAAVILEEGLLKAMGVVGEKFKNGDAFIPDVLIAANAMTAGVEVLKPALMASERKAKGKVVIGSVKGDMHDIGKNLVKIMLEGKGLEVIDLGVGVEAQAFIDTAINENCNIIGCSSLITTTMGAMKDVVELAKERGIRDRIKIMVGGAPVTQNFCDSIGADFYAPDAATASEIAFECCMAAK